MFEHVCQPGESVINEGDDGDNFYVIESGNYDVYKVEKEGCFSSVDKSFS